MSSPIKIFLLLQFFSRNSVLGDSCVSLDPTKSPYNSCAGAVDYKFYLPNGYTIEYLNKLATSLLNNTQFSILPVDCQKSFKNMVCSNVYKRCPSTMRLGNSSTYNFKVYSDIQVNLTKISTAHPSQLPSPYIPVPFQRPCKSVCTNVLSKCSVFLGLLGTNLDCNARIDYSAGQLNALYSAFPTLLFPFQYDQSATSGSCNAMTADFSVQGTKEPYLHASDSQGFCSGLVKELYVPPASALNALLAPMQAPYVVQTLIESQLSALGAALPVWLSRDCKVAIRKYFCGSSMYAPAAQNIGQSIIASGYSNYVNYFPAELTAYTFYFPSYPHHSICEDYANSCGEFIAIAGLPALTAQCNTIQKGVASFPTGNQTIESLYIEAFNMNVKFTSSPNRMQSVTTEGPAYETICPEGYVVPNGVDHRTAWIPGSGCAVSCNLPMFTLDEWKIMRVMGVVIPWVSFPLIVFLLVTWLIDKERRKQYLVIVFAFSAVIYTTTQVIHSSYPYDKSHCKTNAVPFDQTDGFNPCNATALVFVFVVNCASAAWMLLSVDIFLKVVLGWRSTHNLKPFFIAYLIIEPSVFLITASTLRFGYTALAPVCYPLTPENRIVLSVPVGVMIIIGLGAMLCVIGKITLSFFRSSASETSGLYEKLKVVRTPIIFVVCYSIIIINLETNDLISYRFTDEYTQSLLDFTECVFKNFNGDQSTWKAACGLHQKTRISFEFAKFSMFCVDATSLIISTIYLVNAGVWKFWARQIGLQRMMSISTIIGTSGKFITRRIKVYNDNGSHMEESKVREKLATFIPVKEKGVLSSSVKA